MTDPHMFRFSMTDHFRSGTVAPADGRGRSVALRRRGVVALACFAICMLGMALPASADRIKHPIGVYAGLDKITGRIISFEVATNETVQFGTLQITERACYTRPPTEPPQTISFLQVDEVDASKNIKQIFSGWMFAASPGLHALEHPVYDVWLVDCKGGSTVIATPPDTAAVEPPPVENVKPAPAPKPQKPKRTPATDQAKTDVQNGPVVVGAPPGFTNQRTQPPTQRFSPTPN